MARPKNPRRPRPTRRPQFRSSGSTDEDHGAEESQQQDGSNGAEEFVRNRVSSYTLATDSPEALQIWPDLTKEEKAEILQVSTQQFVHELSKLGIDSQPFADKVLDASEEMTAIRTSFVFAISNDGNIPIPLDPIALVLMIILESHLLICYTRRVYQVKILYLLTVVTVFLSDFHFVLRIFLVGCLVYVARSSLPSIKAVREVVMLPFEDSDASRMAGRLDAFLCGSLLLCSGNWVPWYTAVACVAFAPIILVEIEKLISGVMDKKAIRFIRNALTWIAGVGVVYFSWYSWPLLISLLWFLFPTAMRWTLAVAVFCVEKTLRAFGAVHDALFPNPSSRTGWLRFILSIFAYVTAATTILSTIGLVALVVFFIPPWIRNIVTMTLAVAYSILLAVCLETFTVLRYSIVGALLAFVAVRYLWAKFRGHRFEEHPHG